MIYVAIAALVAFANSVLAASMNPTPTKAITSTRASTQPQTTSEGGRECYRKGVKMRCPLSTSTPSTATVVRIIGIVLGVVVFLVIVYVCLMFYEEIMAFFSKKRNTKGANQQAPPREGILPLYHEKRTSVDTHREQGSVVVESEETPQKMATSTQQMSPPATVTRS